MGQHSNISIASAQTLMSRPHSQSQNICYAFCSNEGLAPHTGTAYLSAVCSMQILLSLPDPRDSSSLPILKRVQAMIKRLRMTKSGPSIIRLPITTPTLENIRVALDRSSHPHKLTLWAIACVAFLGFFRLGELRDTSTLPYLSPGVILQWTARPTQR